MRVLSHNRMSLSYMYRCIYMYMYHIVHVHIMYCRFSSTMPRIKSLINKYGDNLDMELQQRAVEYSAIFSKHDEMRLEILHIQVYLILFFHLCLSLSLSLSFSFFLSPHDSLSPLSEIQYVINTILISLPIHVHSHVHTNRAGLLERMPAMSTKASSTEGGSLLQNGEPSAAPTETTAPLQLQVQCTVPVL